MDCVPTVALYCRLTDWRLNAQGFKDVKLVDGNTAQPEHQKAATLEGPLFKAFALYGTDLDEIFVLGAQTPSNVACLLMHITPAVPHYCWPFIRA